MDFYRNHSLNFATNTQSMFHASSASLRLSTFRDPRTRLKTAAHILFAMGSGYRRPKASLLNE